MSKKLLIPVDFHQLSSEAVALGFQMAERLAATPVLLHAYSDVFSVEQPPVYDTFGFDDTQDVIEDEMLERDLASASKKAMSSFVKKVQEMQAGGAVPKLDFEHILAEGVPEDVIRSYVRSNKPVMVVMATKGKDRKVNDLLGSVAAEVLDTCRTPIFTVPENPMETPVADIVRVAFFCRLDSSDAESMKYMMDLFDNPKIEIFLLPVPEKDDSKNEKTFESFCLECGKLYPQASFSRVSVPEKDFRSNLENCISQQKIELLVVPNRKTNMFTRLFNPSLPHKVLFERDIPMLALPV